MSKKSYLSEPVPTITISVDEIKDYQACSLYHKFKYSEPQTIFHYDEIAFARFDNCLKKIIAYFFYKRQGEATPSYASLLKRWEKIWFPEDMDAYDISHEQHGILSKNMVTYSNLAAKLLLEFYNTFGKKDKGIPVAINQGFLIPILPGVRLSGNIDLVLKYKGSDYRVIKWETLSRKQPDWSYRFDFAALKLGYMHSSNKKYDGAVNYGLYIVGSEANFGFVNMEIKETDINTLLMWSNRIRDKRVDIPRRGYTTYCKSCDWIKECENWNPLKPIE